MAFPAATAGLLAPILGKVLDRVIPDPAARDKAINDILGMVVTLDLGQQEVNKVEAAHSSIFVAGWRPAVGWSCAIGVLYEFLLRPFMIYWGDLMIAFEIIPVMPHPPSISDVLLELTVILLGAGALRTFEKMKGVAR